MTITTIVIRRALSWPLPLLFSGGRCCRRHGRRRPQQRAILILLLLSGRRSPSSARGRHRFEVLPGRPRRSGGRPDGGEEGVVADRRRQAAQAQAGHHVGWVVPVVDEPGRPHEDRPPERDAGVQEQ